MRPGSCLPQDEASFVEFNRQRAFPGKKVVLGTDPEEDGVENRELGRTGGNERPDLGHESYDGHLQSETGLRVKEEQLKTCS